MLEINNDSFNIQVELSILLKIEIRKKENIKNSLLD
jgi:hypothetical protein